MPGIHWIASLLLRTAQEIDQDMAAVIQFEELSRMCNSEKLMK